MLLPKRVGRVLFVSNPSLAEVVRCGCLPTQVQTALTVPLDPSMLTLRGPFDRRLPERRVEGKAVVGTNLPEPQGLP